jgi:hypothetical protein
VRRVSLGGPLRDLKAVGFKTCQNRRPMTKAGKVVSRQQMHIEYNTSERTLDTPFQRSLDFRRLQMASFAI